MRVGVLALQGDVREHIASLSDCGVEPRPVRRPEELAQVDALVLPGGESTTIAKLARSFSLFEPIQRKISEGMPMYGSCAGMILLADHILAGSQEQESFGGLNVTVRRNAFGRQVDSFEDEIDFAGMKVRAVFIRAPWVEKVGEGVETLARIHTAQGERAVAVRNETLMATSFHPELTGDYRVHRYFLEKVARPALEREKTTR